MASTADLTTWLAQQVESTGASMAAQMGAQTLCELHHSGRVTGGLKYEEGKLAAFSALRRALQHSDDPAATMTAILADWEADLARYITADPRSMPWVAYAQGGVDACRLCLATWDSLRAG